MTGIGSVHPNFGGSRIQLCAEVSRRTPQTGEDAFLNPCSNGPCPTAGARSFASARVEGLPHAEPPTPPTAVFARTLARGRAGEAAAEPGRSRRHRAALAGPDPDQHRPDR